MTQTFSKVWCFTTISGSHQKLLAIILALNRKRQKQINMSEFFIYNKCESRRSAVDLHEWSAESTVVIEVRNVVIGVWLCDETQKDSLCCGATQTQPQCQEQLPHLLRPRCVCTSQTSSSSFSLRLQHLHRHTEADYALNHIFRLTWAQTCAELTLISFFVHILSFYQPVHVAYHVFLHLLALLRLLQLPSRHGLFSFLGKLSERNMQKMTNDWFLTDWE